ncbi:hypothetical protein CONLIGDRAFT_406366 [Coniochaeta ligniaria NRRL 30616]|uniref:Uncharacterized protein n=1 Tax=Coniochaeta ligniaria NRRL 30616 TaxID=1408157 RepID=A0A1J7INU9_9PEZI|nr:hypothetical protein CONLIGDRAFT_406366 [Coniochaeta ligniaria NRRL 30616]
MRRRDGVDVRNLAYPISNKTSSTRRENRGPEQRCRPPLGGERDPPLSPGIRPDRPGLHPSVGIHWFGRTAVDVRLEFLRTADCSKCETAICTMAELRRHIRIRQRHLHHASFPVICCWSWRNQLRVVETSVKLAGDLQD